VNQSRRAFLLLGLLLMAPFACRRSEAPARATEWELRSYEVPPADRQALVGVLRGLLTEGRIELSPDGRIALLAPPRIHQQVQKEILQPLAARPRSDVAVPKPNFSITYWMLQARPGTGTPAAASATPPGLEEVASVLPEIRKASRGSELVLLERLRVSSLEGSAKTTGRIFRISQKATLVGGVVVSDINMDALVHPLQGDGLGFLPNAMNHDSVLSTRVSLKPGQTTVVGELALRGAPPGQAKAGRPPGRDDTLFIIMQAAVDDAIAAK
jgi:hypothetical protein